MTVRLSVNVNDETGAFLRSQSAAEGRTVTELVRRMTGLYEFVTDAAAAGKKIQLVEEDGTMSTVTLL